jgi:hypothetical protein
MNKSIDKKESIRTTKVFAKAGLDDVIFISSNVAALVRADTYKFGF